MKLDIRSPQNHTNIFTKLDSEKRIALDTLTLLVIPNSDYLQCTIKYVLNRSNLFEDDFSKYHAAVECYPGNVYNGTTDALILDRKLLFSSRLYNELKERLNQEIMLANNTLNELLAVETMIGRDSISQIKDIGPSR